MSQESEITKKMVVPIKLPSSSHFKKKTKSESSLNIDSQPWVKREFATFMKSATILNQGMSQVKMSFGEDSAREITTSTYVRLLMNLLDAVGKDRKAEISDKIVSALVVDTAST